MNSFLKKNLKWILLILVFLFVVLPLFQSIFGGVGGSFGLRPKSHGCYGISISERSISWLPDGDISVNFPIFLSYQKNTKEGNVLSGTTVYCLGQDYWQGE